jgi:hypothetical protein
MPTTLAGLRAYVQYAATDEIIVLDVDPEMIRLLQPPTR